MICFEIFGIFGKKIAKSQKKNLGKNGLLRCSVRNPRRSIALRYSLGYLAAARPRCQIGTSRVRHGVATVHREQISDFCFRTPRIRAPIVEGP